MGKNLHFIKLLYKLPIPFHRPKTLLFQLVLRHFRWKKELDLTLYMRTISLITSDICLKKLQM